jgi:hypothetical protein
MCHARVLRFVDAETEHRRAYSAKRLKETPHSDATGCAVAGTP